MIVRCSPTARPAPQLARAQGWVRSCAPCAALIALMMLAGCKGTGLGNFDTGGYATPAGISHMDSQSPDAAEDKWLKSYYGESHGWGWDKGKTADPNCGFYNSCESGSATGW